MPSHCVLSAFLRRWHLARHPAAGRRGLQAEAASWQRYVDVVARVLAAAQQPT
jgi:hypothetical protein